MARWERDEDVSLRSVRTVQIGEVWERYYNIGLGAADQVPDRGTVLSTENSASLYAARVLAHRYRRTGPEGKPKFQLVVQFIKPFPYRSDSTNELRGSRRHMRRWNHGTAERLFLSADGKTGISLTGGVYPGDSGIYARLFEYVQTDEETVPGLYFHRVSYKSIESSFPPREVHHAKVTFRPSPDMKKRVIEDVDGVLIDDFDAAQYAAAGNNARWWRPEGGELYVPDPHPIIVIETAYEYGSFPIDDILSKIGTVNEFGMTNLGISAGKLLFLDMPASTFWREDGPELWYMNYAFAYKKDGWNNVKTREYKKEAVAIPQMKTDGTAESGKYRYVPELVATGTTKEGLKAYETGSFSDLDGWIEW